MPTLQLIARVCLREPSFSSEDRLQRTAHRSDSIGGIVGVVAYARQSALQVFQLCVLVVETNAGRQLGRRLCAGRRPGGSDPRRKERTPDDLVPVKAQTGLDEQARVSKPAVLKISAGLEVMARERSLAGKGAVPQQRPVLAQIIYRRTRNAFVEADVVEIDARFEIMASVPMARRQI